MTNSEINSLSIKLEIRTPIIRKFTKLFKCNPQIKSSELIRQTGIPQTHLIRLIKEFSNLPQISVEDITPVDKKLLFKIIKKYQPFRPKSDRSLDQFSATIYTSVKRAIKLLQKGDLTNKNIAFLGDDDLTSVAVALISKANRITVFEIDDRLIKLLNKISSENKLPIEVVKQDLTHTLPNAYLGKYDLIFTDPPYTPSGISVFLNQSILLLKQSFLSRIYLCYGNSDRAREREIVIQKLITDRGLLIHSKLFQFNRYHGAQSIGSRSSLFLLDWTPTTKTVKTDTLKIYTHE